MTASLSGCGLLVWVFFGWAAAGGFGVFGLLLAADGLYLVGVGAVLGLDLRLGAGDGVVELPLAVGGRVARGVVGGHRLRLRRLSGLHVLFSRRDGRDRVGGVRGRVVGERL